MAMDVCFYGCSTRDRLPCGSHINCTGPFHYVRTHYSELLQVKVAYEFTFLHTWFLLLCCPPHRHYRNCYQSPQASRWLFPQCRLDSDIAAFLNGGWIEAGFAFFIVGARKRSYLKVCLSNRWQYADMWSSLTKRHDRAFIQILSHTRAQLALLCHCLSIRYLQVSIYF